VHVIHAADAYRILARGDRPDALSPEPEGVHVHRLESRWPTLSCLATQQSGRPLVHGRQIRRLIAEIAPDVIHYHNISLVGGPGLLAYGEAVKLYTAHEHWLVCPSHILWRHGRELCDGRECVRCQIHYRRPPQLWRKSGLLEAQCEHVDVFLAPSRFTERMHREFGFSREMEVLPLFLSESEPLDPAAGDAPSSERPYFLFVGRLELIKGLQDVIPVFDDDLPAELWIAGEGGYEPALRSLAKGRSRVRFLGKLPAEQLRPLYANARAVVASSRCYEVFPMILLEAFHEGTPVIARRLGPYPEIIEQSGGGILFGSPLELRRAIEELAGDPKHRDRLGAAGRRALREKWSEEVVLGQYLELIARVARDRGREETLRALEAEG
jgi:glycosyltransferase involved in cell wall biosynthesis